MIVYVCMHCRVELYREGEEEVECIDHPWTPAERKYIDDDVQEDEQNGDEG